MANEEEKCYSCGGKGYYTQMHGLSGADDFGGEGFETKPTIHKYPCKACNGTGLKEVQSPIVLEPNQEGKVCEYCGKQAHAPFACAEYVKSVAVPDEMLCPIERPVYYNKFSGYICDRNDVPVVEVVGENDKVGQFISEAINNFKQ